MTVWLVEKRAVYQHGILGVFKWEQDARLCAEAAVKDPGPENRDWAWDGDGHHTYVLMRVELGASDPTPVDVAELHCPGGKVLDKANHVYMPGVPYRWRTL